MEDDNDGFAPGASAALIPPFEKLRRHIDGLIRLSSGREQWEKRYQTLVATVVEGSSEALDDNARLLGENERLKKQLDDAHSKIFSLQPLFKVLTPEEIGNVSSSFPLLIMSLTAVRDYDRLVGKIEDWVLKVVDSWVHDPEKAVDQLCIESEEREAEVVAFATEIYRYPDLVRATFYPDLDTDIICAAILRYIHEQVFQLPLFGCEESLGNAIEEVYGRLQEQSQPKRDPAIIQNWRAEAYSTMLKDQNFQEARAIRIEQLSLGLVQIMAVLFEPDSLEGSWKDFETECIIPAVTLHDKMLTTITDVHFDYDSFASYDDSGQFIKCVEDGSHKLTMMDCVDITQHRKILDPFEGGRGFCGQDYQERLKPICATRPALLMRQLDVPAGREQTLLVRRQEMLIARGNKQELRELRQSPKSLSHALLQIAGLGARD